MDDVEANVYPSEELKVMADEKVPQVKIASTESKPKKEEEFRGLTKEELMKYADDPSWVRVRWALFILFWLIWAAMLAASVAIIILTPNKCPSPDPKDWWQKGPVYKVDIAKFFDSDNDGTGDFKGLEDKLEYLAELDVPSIAVTSFLKGSASGDGVTDFKQVDPSLGTLTDFDFMAKKAKEHNIKVLAEMSLDVTSPQHMWFTESLASNPDYENFYADKTQPRLNFESPEVVAKLKDILTFWMSHGVDGFNLVSVDSYHSADNIAKTQALLKQLRSVRKPVETTSDNEDDPEANVGVILTSVGDVDKPAVWYGDKLSVTHIGDLLHLAGSGDLMDDITKIGGGMAANGIINYINTTRDSLPKNAWPALTLSRADSRVAATSPEMIDPLNMLIAMLPVTPFIHFGDELGLAGGNMDWEVAANQTKATEQGLYSHYGVVRKLASMRTQKTVLFGAMHTKNIDGCLLLGRVKKGNPGYLYVFNPTDKTVNLDATEMKILPPKIRIEVESTEGKEFSKIPQDVKSIEKKDMVVEPKQALIYTFVPVLED